MLNIKGVKINWNNKWGNNPNIKIIVDEKPNFNIKFEKRIINGKTHYFGEQEDGIVQFYIYNPKDPTGSYGDIANLPMVDGTVDTVKGLWNSNSDHMVECGFKPTNEISFIKEADKSHWVGLCYILTSKLAELLDEFLPMVKYDYNDNGIIWVPKDQPANTKRQHDECSREY